MQYPECYAGNLVKSRAALLLLLFLCYAVTHISCFSAQAIEPEVLAKAKDLLRQSAETLEENQEQLKDLDESTKEIAASLRGIKQKMVQLKSESFELEKERRKQEARVRRFQDKYEAAQEVLDKRQRLFNNRIIRVYKMYRRAAALDYLVLADSVSDLLRRSKYLTNIARMDNVELSKLRSAVSQVEKRKRQLEFVQREKAAKIEAVRLVLLELEEQGKQHTSLLRKLREKQVEREEVVAALKSSANNMQEGMATLMGKTQPQRPETPSFAKVDLNSLRGKLSLPVDGRVVQRFGKQRHGEFGEEFFVKGVELQSDIGASVRSIAPGKVVYADSLPAYGNVVIVEHGFRYFSLYGRLGTAEIQAGDLVEEGTKLAVTGRADNKGRNFYFELRKAGKAIDPLKYLAGRYEN